MKLRLLVFIARRTRRIEGRPASQYLFHKIMSRVWLASMLVTIPVVIFFPAFWAKIGILLVAEISYYANYATDMGVMAAANASTTDQITEYDISGDSGAGEPGEPGPPPIALAEEAA